MTMIKTLVCLLLVGSLANAVELNFEDAEQVIDVSTSFKHSQYDLRQTIPGEPNVDYPIYSAAPRTNFNCVGRHEGYYADTETRCQVFRICTNTDLTGNGFAFLCPNGTLFSQRDFVCDWYRNVDCEESERYYSKNANNALATKEEMIHKARQMIEYPIKTISNAFAQSAPQNQLPKLTFPNLASAQVTPTHTVTQRIVPNRPQSTTTTTKSAPSTPSGNKVYVSSLGELSTDPGVFFDRKSARVLSEPKPHHDLLPPTLTAEESRLAHNVNTLANDFFAESLATSESKKTQTTKKPFRFLSRGFARADLPTSSTPVGNYPGTDLYYYYAPTVATPVVAASPVDRLQLDNPSQFSAPQTSTVAPSTTVLSTSHLPTSTFLPSSSTETVTESLTPTKLIKKDNDKLEATLDSPQITHNRVELPVEDMSLSLQSIHKQAANLLLAGVHQTLLSEVSNSLDEEVTEKEVFLIQVDDTTTTTTTTTTTEKTTTTTERPSTTTKLPETTTTTTTEQIRTKLPQTVEIRRSPLRPLRRLATTTLKPATVAASITSTRRPFPIRRFASSTTSTTPKPTSSTTRRPIINRFANNRKANSTYTLSRRSTAAPDHSDLVPQASTYQSRSVATANQIRSETKKQRPRLTPFSRPKVTLTASVSTSTATSTTTATTPRVITSPPEQNSPSFISFDTLRQAIIDDSVLQTYRNYQTVLPQPQVAAQTVNPVVSAVVHQAQPQRIQYTAPQNVVFTHPTPQAPQLQPHPILIAKSRESNALSPFNNQLATSSAYQPLEQYLTNPIAQAIAAQPIAYRQTVTPAPAFIQRQSINSLIPPQRPALPVQYQQAYQVVAPPSFQPQFPPHPQPIDAPKRQPEAFHTFPQFTFKNIPVSQRRLDVMPVEGEHSKESLFYGISSYQVPLNSIGRLASDTTKRKY